MAGKYRRSTLEIKVEILRFAQEPIVPTRLMYSCNLSWKSLQAFVGELISAGLLEALISEEPKISGIKPEEVVFDGRSKIKYVLSEKGRKVLIHYKRTEASLKPLEKLPSSPKTS